VEQWRPLLIAVVLFPGSLTRTGKYFSVGMEL